MPNVVVDQHFAERGRIGRLVAAVAQNPRMLGLGIDEDTAVIIHRQRFAVLGAGAVSVVDGRRLSFSNVAEEESDRTLSVFDLKLHLLSQGDSFALTPRTASSRPAKVMEE